MPITGKHVGLLLCEALGISKTRVHRIDIIAEAGQTASVRIQRYLEMDDVSRVVTEMKKLTIEETETSCAQLNT